MAPLLLLSSISVAHLLQCMNEYLYMLRFMLPVEDFVDFDKHIMSCIHHYSTTQNSFTAQSVPCAPPVYFSLPCLQSLVTTHLFHHL